MFEKQTIKIDWDNAIDDRTIEVLKNKDKYKFYKLDFTIANYDEDRFWIFFRMLDEIPELEISMIHIWECNNELICALEQKPIFNNEQDLFKILDFDTEDAPEQSESYEYLQKVANPQKHDMS